MAITTLDLLLAGLQQPEEIFKAVSVFEATGVHHSTFYTPGRPGAAVAPTPGLAGAALTTYAGQIPFTNPGSGNSYLARLSLVSSAGTCSCLLADRLWHNSGFTPTQTTAHTINSVAWPARDRLGATNGDGVLVGIEVSTATTNSGAIANTTMVYTNQAGTGSKTATMTNFPATAVAGTFVPFELSAGDTGVRSVQSITLGTSYAPSGSPVIHAVAYRPLARLDILSVAAGATLNFAGTGFPRLFDNTVPFLLALAAATTALNIYGQMNVAQG